MTQTTTRTLSDVLHDFRFAMLTTQDLTARPLTVQEVDGDTVRFLIDATPDWVAQAEGAQVALALADGSTFASIHGVSTVRDDRATIERLYDAGADAFFDGKDDPRIRVLDVVGTKGEWWDGPSGRLGTALALARARVTGDPSQVGDAGSIDLR